MLQIPFAQGQTFRYRVRATARADTPAIPTLGPRPKVRKLRDVGQLSGGSRLVIDGARRADATQVGENANENIKAVADDLRAGKRYPALIAVESKGGFLILVEGHTRATAYVLAQIALVEEPRFVD